MDKNEVLARLGRMRDAEFASRDGCDRLVRGGSMDKAAADRHVAECNRNAAALILAIELVEVSLEHEQDQDCDAGDRDEERCDQCGQTSGCLLNGLCPMCHETGGGVLHRRMPNAGGEAHGNR